MPILMTLAAGAAAITAPTSTPVAADPQVSRDDIVVTGQPEDRPPRGWRSGR